MIRFEEITNKNIWKVCALEPFENQKEFVAENINSLAEAYATRNEGNNALPLAVYNDLERPKRYGYPMNPKTRAQGIYTSSTALQRLQKCVVMRSLLYMIYKQGKTDIL